MLVAAGGGLWRWSLAYTHYGPAVVWRWSLPWFLAALGLSPAFFLGVYSLWRSRGQTVALYPSGLIVRRARRKIELPWQEIQSLNLHNAWQNLPLVRSGRPRLLVIRTHDGQQLRLTSELEHFDRLVESIKAKVYPRMHRSLAAAFNQGNALSFGPLTLAPSGLKWRNSTTPWGQVAAATLDNGKIVIRDREGKRVRLAAASVPNADLCLQMIESVIQSQ